MSEEVELPRYHTGGSACFDLTFNPHSHKTYSGYNIHNGHFEREFGKDGIIGLAPGDRVLVPTGLIMQIPSGYSVRVHPRSSVALKTGLGLCNSEGIVDSDYFHESFIPVINNTQNRISIAKGDRLAQAELVEVTQAEIVETKVKPEQSTDRVGGFGSTGK